VLSLAASALFIVLTAIFSFQPVSSPSPVSRMSDVLRLVDLLMILPLLSFFLSLAMKYRKRLIEGQEKIDRLNNAISALSSANLNLQEYANRAEQASMVEERKRITREIHDAVGYAMTNTIMMLEAASDMIRLDPDRVTSLIDTARENTRRILEDIRNALHLLRAQEEPTESGATSFSKLVRVFETATGTRVRLELGNTPAELPLDVEFVVYHFIQEALTNSFRHGKATEVRILFWIQNGALSVTVRDNGGGSDQIKEGIGISGMRERLEKVKGELQIAKVVDGFQIKALIPVKSDT
jgi:signal transduction histidine kinase